MQSDEVGNVGPTGLPVATRTVQPVKVESVTTAPIDPNDPLTKKTYKLTSPEWGFLVGKSLVVVTEHYEVGYMNAYGRISLRKIEGLSRKDMEDANYVAARKVYKNLSEKERSAFVPTEAHVLAYVEAALEFLRQ